MGGVLGQKCASSRATTELDTSLCFFELLYTLAVAVRWAMNLAGTICCFLERLSCVSLIVDGQILNKQNYFPKQLTLKLLPHLCQTLLNLKTQKVSQL